jgi:hypothetical protein
MAEPITDALIDNSMRNVPATAESFNEGILIPDVLRDITSKLTKTEGFDDKWSTLVLNVTHEINKAKALQKGKFDNYTIVLDKTGFKDNGCFVAVFERGIPIAEDPLLDAMRREYGVSPAKRDDMIRGYLGVDKQGNTIFTPANDITVAISRSDPRYSILSRQNELNKKSPEYSFFNYTNEFKYEPIQVKPNITRDKMTNK